MVCLGEEADEGGGGVSRLVNKTWFLANSDLKLKMIKLVVGGKLIVLLFFFWEGGGVGGELPRIPLLRLNPDPLLTLSTAKTSIIQMTSAVVDHIDTAEGTVNKSDLSTSAKEVIHIDRASPSTKGSIVEWSSTCDSQ